MRFKFIKLAIFGVLIMSCKCGLEDVDDISQCDLTDLVKSVSEANGTIWFDSQAQAYAIFKGIEGTFDGQDIGVVCDLPDDYKEEGLKVIFGGKYFENKTFTTQIPGQKYYNLELTSIEMKQE
ncbi:hypothetical protein [Pararhodonellum marinum]|uniref:hypothetical protein n=1 Tax=Pararhodonellum marinum TaxID=2755358 RepID=UPI00188E862A|nr:hypothetical protein [Pararhodonellum marinum]